MVIQPDFVREFHWIFRPSLFLLENNATIIDPSEPVNTDIRDFWKSPEIPDYTDYEAITRITGAKKSF
jgi:hypothetical protein